MKFRIGILFTLFNLATINGFSQSLNKVYSKSGLDYFTKVFETKDGYDAFGITSSFDIGFRDILFTKLDSCGEVVSSFAYGGIREENLVDVFQKTSGNYAVFCSTCSYTPVGSRLEQDILVFEIESDGTLVKSSVIERSDNSNRSRESPSSVIQCFSGEYIIHGGDNGNNTLRDDAILLKLDKNLDPIFYKTWSLDDDNIGYGIVELSKGSLLTSSLNADFTSQTYSMNIFKHTRNGEIIKRNMLSIPNDMSKYAWPIFLNNTSISLNDEAYFLLQSNISSPASFILLKVDSNANLMWAKSYKLANSTNIGLQFYTIYADNQSIYIGGNTYNNRQPFVMKVDTSGSVQWAKNIPSLSTGILRGIDLIKSRGSKLLISGSSFNSLSNSGVNGFFSISDTSNTLLNCESLISIQEQDFPLNSSMSGAISSSNVFKSWDQSITRTSVTLTAENVCPWEQRDTTLCQGDSIRINNRYEKVAGIYPDTLINSTGCDSVVLRNIILLNEQIPQVDLGKDTTLCDGDEITLENKIPSTLDKEWQDGSSTVNFMVTSSGEYWLKEENECGEARDTIEVKYNSNPQVDLGKDTTLCDGDEITLRNRIPSNLSKQWQDGSTADTLLVQGAGEYWLLESNVCGVSRDTVDVQLEPDPSLSIGRDTTLCEGEELVLEAKTNGVRLEWSDGSTEPKFVVRASGTYGVTSTSLMGCTRYVSVDVTSISCEKFELEMPNVFTPNGDRLNQVFEPIIIKGLGSARLEIYNRWGEKMYETSDMEKGWDGVYRGKPVPEGEYFWILYYQISDTNGHINGTVTLIR